MPAELTESPVDAATAARFDAAMRISGPPTLRAQRFATSFEDGRTPGIDDWLSIAEADSVRWTASGGFVTVRRILAEDREVVAAGLAPFGWTRVRARLLERVGESGALSGGLRSAASLVPSEDLGLLVDVVRAGGRLKRLSRGTRAEFSIAVATAAQRHGRASGAWRQLLTETPPALVAPMLAGLTDDESRMSLERGTACLGAVPAADALLLTRLTRIADGLASPIDGVDASPARAALSSKDTSVRVEAARLLAALDDVAAIPDLIAALRATRRPGTHGALVNALERLSGERQIPFADDWDQWYKRAKAWRRDEAPALLAELRCADTSRVNRALLSLARWRVFRHQFDVAVVAASKSDDPECLHVAAAVLGHIGTRNATVRLIELLGHPETSVRKDAYQALRRSTGLDHGEDLAAWTEAITE